MNSADVLTAILHARENGDDPLLILAEDSPLMDAAREALKPKAPYQSHALDEAVSKFLCWRLPRDFHPDGGISLTYPTESVDGLLWPTGTNLFTAEQARNMLEHVVGERIALLEAELSLYRNGYKGACYACETVGEKNVSLDRINKGLDVANIVFVERIAELESANATHVLEIEMLADENRVLREQVRLADGVAEGWRQTAERVNQDNELLETENKALREQAANISPRKLIEQVAAKDFLYGGHLCLKLGGDGDNGEYLISLLEECLPPQGEG